jgi:hypothetical protein
MIKFLLRIWGANENRVENEGKQGADKQEDGDRSARGQERGVPQALLDAALADNDRPPLVYDQHGNEVPRSEMLARLEEWDLTPDVENLTVEGQLVLERQGDRGLEALDEMAEASAFGIVQGRHIVLSIPETKPLDKQRLEKVVRETVKRTLGAWGYPALVAVHLEHGRMIRHVAIWSRLSDAASYVGLFCACVLHRLVVDRLFRRWQHPAVGLEEVENVFVLIDPAHATNVLVEPIARVRGRPISGRRVAERPKQ